METKPMNRMEPGKLNRTGKEFKDMVPNAFADKKEKKIRDEAYERVIAILVSDFGLTFKDVKELRQKLDHFERG